MRISFGRQKRYHISEKQGQALYNKYLNRLDALDRKGIHLDRLSKHNVIAAIEFERGKLSRKGRYASDIVNNIINEQRYEGKMKRNEAIAFRKAVGSDEKIVKIQSYDREDYIKMHEKELSNFWKSIKNDKKKLKEWNDILGTDYDSPGKIISNYFFGSK